MNKIKLDQIDSLIIDFDGVLTDNKVIIDENGKESVKCNRGDGLAFNALKKFKINILILSTEKNSVVAKRAEKLQVKCVHGVENKESYLSENVDLYKALYIGNDLNDYNAMNLCRYKVCPKDSHELIIRLADYTLPVIGGEGVVRYLVENIFEINLVKEMYKIK